MLSNRREWLWTSLSAATWTAIASAHEHARQAVANPGATSFAFFDERSARQVAAIAEQILPSDDGPGATEAGVVYFIDHALTSFDADKQDLYRTGLRDVNIAGLSSEEQAAFMKTFEHSDFFEVIRTHAVLGFLGHPKYGGNRDKAGWKYIGFEDRMAWHPPFGYYDGEGR